MLFRRGRSTSLIAGTHEFIVNDHVALIGSYRFMGVYMYVYTYILMYVYIHIYCRQLSSRELISAFIRAHFDTSLIRVAGEFRERNDGRRAIAIESTRISITDVRRDAESARKTKVASSFMGFNHVDRRIKRIAERIHCVAARRVLLSFECEGTTVRLDGSINPQ